MSTRGHPNSYIDFLHRKVHEGRFFSGGHYVASLANGGTIDILFQNGEHAFHGVPEVITGGDATLQLYEGTTFSAPGTAVTMSNHNRNAATQTLSGATHTPTVTAVGTQMNGTILIPGGKNNSSGASGEFSQEFVLKPNTTYMMRVTNISGVAQAVSAIAKGYVPTL